jgi:2,4-dienoyl-CoA reductase-like NADH-dependent reductase (Old Yellow Enzyme family)
MAARGSGPTTHVPGLKRIVDFLHAQGVVAGLQIGHAGRKASNLPPWRIGTGAVLAETERWTPVAPSAIPFSASSPMPDALTEAQMDDMLSAWTSAAERAVAAGFDLLEIHGAHGYLISEFLSPASNQRTDRFGGSRENRMRFPLQVLEAVRAAWPSDRPLSMRISAEDGLPGGWSIDDSIVLSRAARDRGLDVIDVSGGGFDGSVIPPRPGMFLDWAAAIRAAVGGPVMAVGLLGDAVMAEAAVTDGKTDLIALGRAALDDPNWPMHAARALGVETASLWTKQAGYAIDRWPMRPASGPR